MNHKGSLKIINHYQQYVGNGSGSVTVECDCGNVFTCYASRYKSMSGVGCAKCHRTRSMSGANNPKYKDGRLMEHRKEYSSYTAMIRRCYDKNVRSYKWYGDNGISVCDRWLGDDGFRNFLTDMGKKQGNKQTIDRIDYSGNYEPSNCRWASWDEQLKNTRRSVKLTINGVTMNLSEWMRQYNIPRTSYYRAIKRGNSPEEIIFSYI